MVQGGSVPAHDPCSEAPGPQGRAMATATPAAVRGDVWLEPDGEDKPIGAVSCFS